MKSFFLFSSLLFLKLSFSQTNLIPNGNLELYDTCPSPTHTFNGTIVNWYNPTQSSPDYFNSCANFTYPGLGVPNNFTSGVGFQLPHSGNAYFGLALYVDPVPQQREYWQIELSDSLKKDSLYKIEFYVNLQNGMKYCVKEFNIFFSDSSFIQSTMFYLDATPQIRNIQTTFIKDTLNWIKIQSYYVAYGGEKFMTVGNILNDSLMEHELTGFGTVVYAYYYFDDFYLGRVSDTTGILEQENEILFTIYPNPANEIIIVESNSPPLDLFLTDVMGRQIMRLNCTNNKSYFNISYLSDGIYFIRKETFCKKLIVRR